MITEDKWRVVLANEFAEYVDVHGNVIYPIKKQHQWLLYNDYCLGKIVEDEELDRTTLSEAEIADLCEFWKFSKKKTKEDNTYLCLFDNKGEYKVIAYYRDKIKEVGTIKGERRE